MIGPVQRTQDDRAGSAEATNTMTTLRIDLRRFPVTSRRSIAAMVTGMLLAACSTPGPIADAGDGMVIECAIATPVHVCREQAHRACPHGFKELPEVANRSVRLRCNS